MFHFLGITFLLLFQATAAITSQFLGINISLIVNHLVVDYETGDVYAGAVNRIIHLDSELNLMEEVFTGPLLDDPRCIRSFGQASCSDGGPNLYTAVPTNNINKVLVIDPIGRKIITCGSVFQGICQSRQLSNLSASIEPDVRGNTDYFVAANDPIASTVAVVGLGPNDQNVLYVAATYTGTQLANVRQAVPAVSSRSLVPGGPNMFRFTYDDGLTGGTVIRLRREAIEKYAVNYVTAFTVGGFVYFLTNQPESFTLESSGSFPFISKRYVSKIIQVCNKDQKFHSYVEIPIVCKTATDEYDLVQSATVVKVRDADSNEYDAIVATFSKSQKSDPSSPGMQSAICVFRLLDVRKSFTENIQNCFSSNQKYVGQQFGNRICTSSVRVGYSYIPYNWIACCLKQNAHNLNSKYKHVIRIFYRKGTVKCCYTYLTGKIVTKTLLYTTVVVVRLLTMNSVTRIQVPSRCQNAIRLHHCTGFTLCGYTLVYVGLPAKHEGCNWGM